MGTRSQTYIHDGDFSSAPFVCIYRQMDGYPTGMGDDIVSALGSRKLVNGYLDTATEVNGMHCAAALLVSHLKGDECGSIYLYSPDYERSGCDYYYDLAAVDGVIHLRCTGGYGDKSVLFEGPISSFNGAEVEAKDANEDEDDEDAA